MVNDKKHHAKKNKKTLNDMFRHPSEGECGIARYMTPQYFYSTLWSFFSIILLSLGFLLVWEIDKVLRIAHWKK